ncbi:MAG: hypothetical protein M3389_06380 [Actinomycetota bacterium]|nr:hypothetical protein [Actinomycetota bacterium]
MTGLLTLALGAPAAGAQELTYESCTSQPDPYVDGTQTECRTAADAGAAAATCESWRFESDGYWTEHEDCVVSAGDQELARCHTSGAAATPARTDYEMNRSARDCDVGEAAGVECAQYYENGYGTYVDTQDCAAHAAGTTVSCGEETTQGPDEADTTTTTCTGSAGGLTVTCTADSTSGRYWLPEYVWSVPTYEVDEAGCEPAGG